jgi:predicted SAM-dependent methyltransferase
MKTLLNVGCGLSSISQLKGFDKDDWKEIRLDIDNTVKPDVVGSLTDMSLIETGSVDAVYSAYNLDHIYPHEVPIALKEFYRVLNEDGIALVQCPDIQTVCELIAQDKLLELLYESPVGPIYPIDVIYGHRWYLKNGNEYMAKKVGFTYSALDASFAEAGFKARYGGRMPANGGELNIVAFKQKIPEEQIKQIADPLLPMDNQMP